MLTSMAYNIAPSLTELFNLSLTTGIFPTNWKIARVVPVPKGDNLRTSEDGYEICVIFFNVRKAFDSMLHAPLLQKMK